MVCKRCLRLKYYPELHLISALDARTSTSPVVIGCQGVFRHDTIPGGNFGAFTTQRPAAAMAAAGCASSIIGHCEERDDLTEILTLGGVEDMSLVNQILNREVLSAQNRGMDVLYCVGEKSHERDSWQKALREQLAQGLSGVDMRRVVVAYEPVWSIGPGKQPADKPYIEKVVRFIKEVTGGVDVVYGGGLKKENARMLASIPELDGGLIALTRFTGDIGFYPEEYLQIIDTYLNK